MSDVKPMALSTAIRLGSMLKPQAFHIFRDRRGGSCAVQAACDAVGGAKTLVQIIPAEPALTCPVFGCGHITKTVEPCHAVLAMMVHLNDDHRWTREQIADWVETIEEKDTKPNESATHVAAVDPSGGDRESVAVATT